MATQDSWAHNSKKRQQYASATKPNGARSTLVYATACTCVQSTACHHDTRPIQVVCVHVLRNHIPSFPFSRKSENSLYWMCFHISHKFEIIETQHSEELFFADVTIQLFQGISGCDGLCPARF